ncbi:hypothetical protein JKP88DRAFT_255325 [Tribonema minus]|uniref:Uncharacterized protein n=1 Tax=Tribonema minus TaxID=303371 RepID=A0A835Z1L3_9STRA|nr:hypothetical protein JKP88DRAFT_255325 [Tribonema minus]
MSASGASGSNKRLQIVNSEFVSNTAQHAGGALYIGPNVFANISASNFTWNSAAVAGAIFNSLASSGKLAVSNSALHNNAATIGAGGAVLQQGKALRAVVTMGDFDGNSAQCCFAGNYTATSGASCVDVSAGYDSDW